MAALVAGVQYGLSSRNSSENPNEKPVVIFVKFTDSAFRALEEYIKNVDRTTQKPTIQFLQNKGHLSIPTQQAQSSRPQIFNFTLSPNADEGTFECLQSKGSRALESFGAPSHNMCIQAKDDVYETTRHRMAVAEEQQKKNCTKVIKPDLDDIGRKVKLTSWMSGTSNHSAKGFSSGSLSDNNMRIMHNPPAQNHSRVVSNNHAQKPGNPELMRRPIRERLIHLLALRPYKKPELYDRINRVISKSVEVENRKKAGKPKIGATVKKTGPFVQGIKNGLSEKDRKMFTQVLSQVAKLGKDNTYHPVRSVWNDVQEDWPFYTEQDRQMLRRRKPENLTPPGSSDTGSSGSGQSPTSTHPGSPPSVTHAPKRPGYHQSVDGIESKRRRISHYHKLQNDTNRPNSDPMGENYHQEDGRSQQYGDNNNLGFVRGRRLEDERMYIVKNASDSKKSNNNNNNNNNNNVISDVNKRPGNNYAANDVKDANDVNYASDAKKCISDAKPMNEQKFDEKVKRSDSPATVTSSQTQGDAQRSKWGIDYSDTRTSYEDTDTIQENTVSASDPIPDYLIEYTTITNDSQRRRYKDDFNAHYEEYKSLYAVMEGVTQKFSNLETKLKGIKDRSSPQYQKIKKLIMMEYEKNKSDKVHQEAKKRFQYLHEKLSRIKKLVSEYDNSYY